MDVKYLLDLLPDSFDAPVGPNLFLRLFPDGSGSVVTTDANGLSETVEFEFSSLEQLKKHLFKKDHFRRTD